MKRITTLAPCLDCRAKIQPRPVPRITGLHITNQWSRLAAKRVEDSWRYVVIRGKGISYHTTGIRIELSDAAVYPQPQQQVWCVRPSQLTGKLVTVPVTQVRRRHDKGGGGIGTGLNFSAITVIGSVFNRTLRNCVDAHADTETSEILSSGISITLIPIRRGVRRLRSPYH